MTIPRFLFGQMAGWLVGNASLLHDPPLIVLFACCCE
jgi:hypothetical protein